MEYWKECITEAFEDAGIEATSEQLETVISWVDGAHENYGLATGSEFIPNPMIDEVEEIKREMARQQEKHERQLSGICKGVARRRNVDEGGVSISDDGEVTYTYTRG